MCSIIVILMAKRDTSHPTHTWHKTLTIWMKHTRSVAKWNNAAPQFPHFSSPSRHIAGIFFLRLGANLSHMCGNVPVIVLVGLHNPSNCEWLVFTFVSPNRQARICKKKPRFHQMNNMIQKKTRWWIDKQKWSQGAALEDPKMWLWFPHWTCPSRAMMLSPWCHVGLSGVTFSELQNAGATCL